MAPETSVLTTLTPFRKDTLQGADVSLAIGAVVSFHEGRSVLTMGRSVYSTKKPKCPIGAEVVGVEIVGAEVSKARPMPAPSSSPCRETDIETHREDTCRCAPNEQST